MTTDKIVPPIVFFHDDGVRIYQSVEEIERHLEAWIVDEVPKHVGFDFQLNGLRLDTVGRERKVFGLFKIKEERVKVRLDDATTVAGISDNRLEQMREYLTEHGSSSENIAAWSTKEQLKEVLKTTGPKTT